MKSSDGNQKVYLKEDHQWRQMTAKVVRVISVPPVMVSALIIILSLARKDIFMKASEIAVALLCLAIIPLLAYPFQTLIPKFKNKGREGQRNLALILSVIGYLAAWIYGMIAKSNGYLMLIFGTYLLSVAILVIFNKVFQLRASGHACSISGPVVFVCYFLGFKALGYGIILYGMILWASLELKRHTVKDFIMGTFACILALFCNIFIYL